MISKPRKIPWRVIWLLVCAVHLYFAYLAWRRAPRGFEWGEVRYWANNVAPIAVAVACLLGIVGLLLRRKLVTRFVVAGMIATHLTAAATLMCLFPISGRIPAAIAAVMGILLLILSWRATSAESSSSSEGPGIRWGRVPILLGALAGCLLGIGWPLSQRGADPNTHPAAAYREVHTSLDANEESPDVPLPQFAAFAPRLGSFHLSFAHVMVNVDPFLNFISRSPDRGWTVLAGERHRVSPHRKLVGWDQNAGTTNLYYSAGEQSRLQIQDGDPQDSTLRVNVATALPNPVYSHLNTFCRLEVVGHNRLFVSFSPCPERIRVRSRPSRFGYLDSAGIFHVVEASRGENGPFKELASGRLGPEDQLHLTFYEDSMPLGRVTLDDFAAQASTQPSPTAGWDLPENAIQFRSGNHPEAPAYFWITLAGTAVGRGWDSVGHATGVYRNEMEFSLPSMFGTDVP